MRVLFEYLGTYLPRYLTYLVVMGDHWVAAPRRGLFGTFGLDYRGISVQQRDGLYDDGVLKS